MILLFFTAPIFADPDCPESKPSQNETTTPAPSTSPQTEGASKEPSTTKDQIGLTLDPSTMIPDKPIAEEKNPERKRFLDNIFEAEKMEVDAKIRRDEIDRLQKDLEERRQKVHEKDQKLLKEWDDVIEKDKQTRTSQSFGVLAKETVRIMRELDINWGSLKNMRKQAEDLHQEWLKTLRKETDAILWRFGLEDSLYRMDAVQKEASKQDAQKAPVPKITDGDEEY